MLDAICVQLLPHAVHYFIVWSWSLERVQKHAGCESNYKFKAVTYNIEVAECLT
jgi:hypothetical protein